MKVQLKILVAVSCCVLLTDCSQSGGGVPVHHYGEQSKTAKSLGIHTIQDGETLWGISQAYRVELRDLLDLNHLNPPYNIRTGTRIRIPSPHIYTVKTGDTLYRVSRIFDTTTTELARLNHIGRPYVLSKGQVLRLSGLHRSVVSPKSSIEGVQKGVVAPVQSVQSEVLASKEQKNAVTPPKKVTSLSHVVSDPSPSRSSAGFLSPVSGKVVSNFGPKKDGLHNDGINIKAARGTAVRVAENGTVVYAGNEIAGYGNLVLIRHSGGYVTAYAHLEKTLAKKGEIVKRGQTIATVGSSGNVDSPQLHFEIRKGKKAINPSALINL
ncbi:MAG: LysM peptidoglycan-binding domain-containing M23 family metallopeptidase [Alphaproteobacteria bacterium]|nr:LysM peptidoglycan-binding domain-containing M23 family metallopeptidase [Alphaproteobacteria bacterium]